ncbi:hypothetical protein Tsubulata_026154 [Turnera subulata]|uniref:DNA (cytosine-5-)-methyltransferase n=1 Tax=Turnera subulata TaxID=218843 RepID=A0A9Q0FAJ5_9ROSI|nr:hypothetical protein Tsubulata_026154 [Turnera subulata]
MGHKAHIAELADYISANQISKEQQLYESFIEKDSSTLSPPLVRYNDVSKKKRKPPQNESFPMQRIKSTPNIMKGFGVPSEPWNRVERILPWRAVGPPYFYYENVANTPKGVWTTISRFLYDVQPEFVDSISFCASVRKRGYVHNLPICNRFPLLPRPPLTIHGALPSTESWWPIWDPRTHLNCILTCIGSAKLTERIKNALDSCDGEPTPQVKRYVLQECRKWNLIWVGKNRVAPLEPREMEALLGFPEDHTRGINMKERYKALGNSFQVDTVAYHLSVLKERFPRGMNVLSMFSGIGGAEVALYRLGIPLKNVVSIEISATSRSVLRNWWQQTNQRGRLVEVGDIQDVGPEQVAAWLSEFGEFDLVIGGSPCNNLAGGNRVSRNGLEGEESSLFFDYYRILNQFGAVDKNELTNLTSLP